MPNTLGWFEQWKNYYFVLEGYYLYRHQSLTETTPNASYNIKDAKVVDFDKFSNKPNSFAVFLSDGKTISFIAENQFDRERWKAAIDYTNVKTSITTIQESILDACISCDIDGVILHLNEKASTLFGYEKQELVGKNIKVLMDQNKHQMHDRYLATYKETGRRKMIGAPRKVIAKHKNGQEFPIELSLGEIPLQVGGDVRFIGIFRSIRHLDVVVDESQEIAVISKPQDPITSSEFTKILVDTSIKDCFRQIDISVGEEFEPEVAKQVKKIIQESCDKLKSGVGGCFLDLKVKMEQFVEKENILKQEIQELYQKFEQVKKMSRDLKKEVNNKEDTKSIPIQMTHQTITKEHTRNWRFEDFELLQTLGTGTFGRVKLARHMELDEYFAFKILKKKKLIAMKQVVHVKHEKRIQEGLNECPFTVNLFKTFQDEHCVYMILEFVPGGELLTWITLYKRFQENICRFFAAELVLCLEEMHKNNVCFRDLKPENVLLDEHGHVKLGDFGFAKFVVDKTWTTCGTPEYLAPEIILGTGHDRMVDWYSLGILIFEMLSGYPPFHDDDRFKLFESIVKNKMTFPSFFSTDAKDIVKKLTQRDPKRRLGFLGVSEIKEHAFFKGIDWDLYAKKQVPSPIKVKLNDKGSTKYFMKYKDSISGPDEALSKEQDDLFKEF